MTVFDALATLLEYPTGTLGAALDTCLESTLPAAAEALELFAAAVRDRSRAELEELYTRTFDMQPESCLYIGHQLFGEDWRRGMFMARLQHRYGEAGFSAIGEVPDYIPTVLRFVAAAPGGPDIDELLQDCVLPAASRVLGTLEAGSNPYAAVLRALLLHAAPDRTNFETEDLSCRTFSSSPFPILR